VPDARVAAAEAMSIDNAIGGMGTDVVESLQSLAGARLDLGDSVEARTLYRRALEMLRTRVPEPSPIVIVATIDLASALEGGSARERVEADSLIRHVVTLERRLLWEADVLSRDLLAELRLQRPRAAPVSPASGRIAFVSDRDGPDPVGNMGNQEIYIMNADGSGQQRLTHNDAADAAPAVSPDGRMIAFVSNRSGAPELFVMNVDGTGERQLTVPGAGGEMGARQPRWSPDGKQIVFFGSVRPDIYVINLDGTGLKNLTNRQGMDAYPDWSPDGRRIAFTSNRDGAREIYVLNADGTNVARLTSGILKGNVGMWLRPRWSPDGRKIAFATDRDRTDGTSEIYVMNADGSNLVRLTFNDVLDAEPTWSPDGKMIAFHRTVLGHAQVFVMQADGSNQTRITELSRVSFSGFPSWGRRPSPPR
jgi:TolB protein